MKAKYTSPAAMPLVGNVIVYYNIYIALMLIGSYSITNDFKMHLQKKFEDTSGVIRGWKCKER